MRIIISDCSVVYTGRGDTKLNRATRAIFIKSDGAVSIHNDLGNKPLNYMGKDNVFTEGVDDNGNTVWNFDTRKENLTIMMHEVISDSDDLLDVEESLIRDGTERQLQEWLSKNPEALGEGWTFVQREFETGDGPVDLLVQDAEGNFVAVEVKRTAMLPAVDQLRRYVTAIKESYADRDAADELYNPSQVQLDNMSPMFSSPEEYLNDPRLLEVRGIIAALDVRPKTALLAEKRGIDYVVLNKAWREDNNNKTPEEKG